MMTVDLDTLLAADLLSVPADFSQSVMREVYQLPAPMARPGKRERLQWLALLAAAGVGISQVLAFIFGMWATSAAL